MIHVHVHIHMHIHTTGHGPSNSSNMAPKKAPPSMTPPPQKGICALLSLQHATQQHAPLAETIHDTSQDAQLAREFAAGTSNMNDEVGS